MAERDLIRAFERILRVRSERVVYASGDDAAFAVLYGGLGSKLRAFLMRLTGSLLVAEDLLQETFLRIHRARVGCWRASRTFANLKA